MSENTVNGIGGALLLLGFAFVIVDLIAIHWSRGDLDELRAELLAMKRVVEDAWRRLLRQPVRNREEVKVMQEKAVGFDALLVRPMVPLMHPRLTNPPTSA